MTLARWIKYSAVNIVVLRIFLMFVIFTIAGYPECKEKDRVNSVQSSLIRLQVHLKINQSFKLFCSLPKILFGTIHDSVKCGTFEIKKSAFSINSWIHWISAQKSLKDRLYFTKDRFFDSHPTFVNKLYDLTVLKLLNRELSLIRIFGSKQKI